MTERSVGMKIIVNELDAYEELKPEGPLLDIVFEMDDGTRFAVSESSHKNMITIRSTTDAILVYPRADNQITVGKR